MKNHDKVRKEIYKHVEIILQTMSCIATFATFVRILTTLNLPKVFAILPCMLPPVVVARHFSIFTIDSNTLAMLSGVSSGVIVGFLSTVVIPVTGTHDNHQSHLSYHLELLELLHIPVLLGAIMQTLLHVFVRLPPLHRLHVASFAAFLGTFMLVAGFAMMGEDETSADTLKTFMQTYILLFCVTLTPFVSDHQIAWLICLDSFLLLTIWENRHTEAASWNFEQHRLPIPGCFTGMIIVFLLHRSDTIEDNFSAQMTDSYDDDAKIEEIDSKQKTLYRIENNSWANVAIFWFLVTYGMERLSLMYVVGKSLSGHARLAFSDTWLCCVICCGFYGLMSKNFPSPTIHKVIIILLCLFIYISFTLVHHIFANAIFVHTMFGLTFVHLTQNSPQLIYDHY